MITVFQASIPKYADDDSWTRCIKNYYEIIRMIDENENKCPCCIEEIWLHGFTISFLKYLIETMDDD